MTYSPEKRKIEFTLEQAQLAAISEDWLQVTYYLQQVPKIRENESLRSLESTIKGETLSLAFNVLFYGDFQQKWEISKIIPSLGISVVEPLIEILEDETVELEVRWFIVKILGKFQEPTVAIALVNLLQKTEEDELRSIASEVLSHLGEIAIEVLTTLVNVPKYRTLAARSLAYIRSSDTLAPLLTLVTDSDAEIRFIAIEAISSFRDRRVPPILIKALQDTSAKVRKEAAIALGFRGDLCQELDLVNHLQPLLYDLNLEVCRQAATSLGKLPNEAGIKALSEVLSSPHTPITLKLDLVRALGWSETNLALEYLQQALLLETELVCQEIITILGRVVATNLKSPVASILVDFWNLRARESNNLPLKQSLVVSLGELQQIQAKQTLEELAHEKEPRIRLHAIAALKKLNS